MSNVAASVRGRLLNIAKQENIQFQRILTLYKQEGLLHRIVSTQHGRSVVLKGGLLFYQMYGVFARPTKDIDLLGSDTGERAKLLDEVLQTASSVEIEDGLSFDASTISVAPIVGQTEIGGVRGNITAYLGSSRTRLQIDMGFGDFITGGPVERSYRTLLGNRSFAIQTYSDETVAAEKLEALVSLGMVNSRYKDVYDLYSLMIVGDLSDDVVVQATKNTFKRRRTQMPEHPESLLIRHWESDRFTFEWSRFLGRIGAEFPNVSDLQGSLLPCLLRVYGNVRDALRGEES
jgi:predicted nucleotidyltransferase component of viral defense system